jgi:hypothetical protein
MAKPTGNRLLDAISARFSEQILSSSKHVALPVRTQLYWRMRCRSIVIS